MALGSPRVSVLALAELHQLLTERGFRRSSPDHSTIVQEEPGEEPAHVGDAIRFVTGEEITSVYAEADTLVYPDLGVEDCGLLIMTLSGGGIASLDPSWSLSL